MILSSGTPWSYHRVSKLAYPCLVLLLLCVFSREAGAQGIQLDPNRSITQFPLSTWTTDQGLPQNSINVIAQTRDGYLWMGTQDGLARFDGRRFITFNRQNSPLENNVITALFEDPRGALWIGTQGGGLSYYYRGHFTPITEKDGLTSRLIGAILMDSAGDLWVGTYNAGLFRRRRGKFEHIEPGSGFAGTDVRAIVEDAAGNVWIGTQDAGLYRQRDGAFTAIRPADGLCGDDISALTLSGNDALWIGTLEHGFCKLTDGTFQYFAEAQGLPGHSIRSLYEDAQGTLWVGFNHGGLGRISGGKVSSITVTDGLAHDVVRSLYQDREGSLWIGTDGGGLNRLWNGKFLTFGKREGLLADFIYSIYEDRQGAIWAGSEGGGVSRLKDGQLTTYTTKNGLSSDVVISLGGTRDGSVWIGTHADGLNRWKDGRITRYTTKDGLPGDGIYALYEDRGGRLWIATGNGLARYSNGGFSTISTANGLSSNLITAIAEDARGRILVGSFDAGLDILQNGRVVARYGKKQGLRSNVILTVYPDGDATWIGTQDGGLYRLKNGRLSPITAHDGLPAETILQILDDGQGYLWITSLVGLFRISKKELNDFADGRVSRIKPTLYDKADGLRTREFNGGVQPAGWRGRDGRLWFPTGQGIVSVDPNHLPINRLAPTVHLESMVVDGKPYSLQSRIKLPAGVHRIEFHFTGLSYLAPDKVRFRYRLDGADTTWVEAGSSRDAYYMNLPPGWYRFRVMAANNDGVWSERAAAITFYQKPFFYQTIWFYLFCAVALFSAGLGAFQLRLRRLQQRQKELESLVEARTHDLRLEKEETERAKAVIEQQADKLREMDKLKTRFFSNVSHEFRTPLTLNIGPLENALTGVYGTLSPELRKQVEIMLRNARRLLRLINQLLDLSKLDSRSMKLTVQRRDLVSFTEGVVLSFTSFAEKNKIDLRFQTERERYEMYFDPAAMEKILFNLLSNAVKFTPTGGNILVQLRDDVDENSGRKVAQVSVRDTGCGIPEEEIQYVFDRFHQVNGSISRVQEGTGIGLALVQELVSLHGGEVSVWSQVGEGTEFTIRIPEGAEELPDAIILESEANVTGSVSQGPMVEMAIFESDESFSGDGASVPAAAEPSGADRPVVLIVDDNADIREYLATSLNRGYEVVAAVNGRDGLERARQIKPDLIISDVMMPVMDGYELCRAVRKHAEISQTPFVLVTSKVSMDDKLEGLTAGADDYLAKPFNAQELNARVKNLLTLRGHERALEKANTDLKEAVDMKSHVLRIAAHDLRNPLNGIRELARIIRDGHAEPDDQERLLDIIIGSANQMFDLIRQMVEAEALESGTIDLKLRPVHLDAVAQKVVERNRRLAEKKEQHLQVSLEEGITIEANEQWLEAAMENLISNAVKYSPPQKTIQVTVSRNNGSARFAVKDEGPGLTDQDKAKLFQKFQRLSARPTGGETSTGLGLAIVKKIVEMHQGRVWAESEQGNGSTFVIEFVAAAN